MPLPLTSAQLTHLVEKVDPEFTRCNNKLSLQKTGGFSEHLFGKAIAFLDLKKPKSTYYNRIVGLGEAELSLLSDIESLYREEALDCVVSLPSHRQSSKVLSALYDHGFQYIGSDYNFVLKTDDYNPFDLPTNVDVRLVTAESLTVLFDLMRSSGVNIEPEALSSVQEGYCRKPMQFYIAYVDGVPAARASAFYYEDVAWLNNAVTEECYRGQGCHSARLHARIVSARDEGCSLAVSDTEFGSISHRNMARCGFQLGFTSAELMKSFIE